MDIIHAKDLQQFSEERFTKKDFFKNETGTAFILNLLPGQKLPPHPHPNAHIYAFVMEGSGICKVDEEQQEISQSDVIHCQDQQMLSIENQSDGKLSLYVVLAKKS